MTEAEWLAATDPTPMLGFLQEKASERKLRLVAVACCRRIWHRLKDRRCRKVVEVAEQFADGLATLQELEAAAELAVLFTQDVKRDEDMGPTSAAYFVTSPLGDITGLRRVPSAASRSVGAAESIAQCHLCRDIFGNPFRPITLNPAWHTSTVSTLATCIYEEKAFDRMPILADALQDAGCDNEDILNHCRQAGEHVRGCWCVDLLLGKA